MKTKGPGIGKISHHSAVVCAPGKVVFYGGLVGEDSQDKIYVLDLKNNAWSIVPLKVSPKNWLTNRFQGEVDIPARDDHAMVALPSGDGFITFGGFIKGSRVNDVCRFTFDGNALNGELLWGSDPKAKPAPKRRSGLSAGLKDTKLYVFGGQDDDG